MIYFETCEIPVSCSSCSFYSAFFRDIFSVTFTFDVARSVFLLPDTFYFC